MLSTEKIGSALGWVFGAIGVTLAVWTYQTMRDVGHKVDMAVGDLSARLPIDIEDAIIDRAVRTAVDQKVGVAVSASASRAVKNISADMEMQIRKSVNGSYANIEKSVAKEVARQVERLDIESLKRDVAEQAKDAVVKKFDGSLDEISERFNHNLDNVGKIYSSIAESMTKKSDKDVVIKLG